MAYCDFTLEAVATTLNVTTQPANLFPGIVPAPIPSWLTETLARGGRLALISEKSRSEFIVAPVLVASRELTHDQLAIFSGQRLDVDIASGLVGECDFILALGPQVPPLRAPIVTIVEAKKHDIEAGLGQCIAQMIAARRFNEVAGKSISAVFGCVTSGEVWQFMRLVDQVALIHDRSYYLDDVGSILAAIQVIVEQTTSK
ncbi:MAG TPA: hypothetical protein VHR66_14370 [Gemmataceae bacterium]|jgi:hypothetical protein|nr:hypothetical protein [Gemmataceae bacterium]